MDIAFSGKYSRSDLLKSLKIHSNRSKPIAIVRVVLLVGVIAAYLIYLFTSSHTNLTQELGLLLPVLMILYLIGRPFILPYEIISKIMKDQDVKEPITGRISDRGLEWNTSLSNSELKWEVFKEIEIRDNLIMLYQENNWYTLIPRSFFQSDADWQDILAFIKGKIKEPKLVTDYS